jgi:hypothetical protein
MGSWLNGLEGLCHPVSADMRSDCARFRDRAGSGTRPWVARADCGERRIHQDKPEADRGSRRDRFRSAIAGDSQWRGLRAFAQIDSQGLRARHMLKSGLLQPRKALETVGVYRIRARFSETSDEALLTLQLVVC